MKTTEVPAHDIFSIIDNLTLGLTATTDSPQRHGSLTPKQKQKKSKRKSASPVKLLKHHRDRAEALSPPSLDRQHPPPRLYRSSPPRRIDGGIFIKREPESPHGSPHKPLDLRRCIVISDSEGEEDRYPVELPPKRLFYLPASDSETASPATLTSSEMRSDEGRDYYPPPSTSSSSSSSSTSSSSSSSTRSGSTVPESYTHPVSFTVHKPNKRKTPRPISFETERIRNIMKHHIDFETPEVQTKRGRVKQHDLTRIFRPTNRSLEYKNLPFRSQPIQTVLEQTMKYCRDMNVTSKMIILSYTRTQEVKRAVEAARAKLGSMVNLSISCPFVMEHTVPKSHSRSTVERVSAACAATPKAVWDLDEHHTHSFCPRASDFRTIVIQAATPCDFIAAIKICLLLVDDYPKQICVRTCSIDGGTNVLPIYDAASHSYAMHQFDKSETYRFGGIAD